MSANSLCSFILFQMKIIDKLLKQEKKILFTEFDLDTSKVTQLTQKNIY